MRPKLPILRLEIMLLHTLNNKFQPFLKASSNILRTKKLPSPPVPRLENTMQKYLDYAKVLTDQNSYEVLKRKVEKFSNGSGKILQEKLLNYAAKEENWINKFWIKGMYLNNRLPLPIYSNPGYAAYKVEHKCQDDFLSHAAKLIHGVFDYKTLVDNKKIPPERASGQNLGQPMCMSQYWDIFNFYREAKFGTDVLEKLTFSSPGNEHITIMAHKQVYILKVVMNGKIISQNRLFEELKRIYNAPPIAPTLPLGVITAVNRDNCAKILQLLQKKKQNQSILNDIKTSAFVICLDKRTSYGDADTTMEERSLLHMITGGGAKESLLNRWFDKTFQFILTEDGDVGMNYEHSVAEGFVMFKIMDHIQEFVSRNKNVGEETQIEHAKKAEWNMDDETTEMLLKLVEETKFTEHLDLKILNSAEYGKDYIKSRRISPDAYVQLALQWTIYRLKNLLVSAYESASLRRFIYGRVDNIRAATPHALNWVRIMENTSSSHCEKVEAFKATLRNHMVIMQETISGYGIDNHLFALQELDAKFCNNSTTIFQDENFEKSFHFLLSTSQLPWMNKGVVGYGPVVEDGYGCAYKIDLNQLTFFISSMKSCPHTTSEGFKKSLVTTLKDMKLFTQSFEI